MEEHHTDAAGTTLKTYTYGHDLLAVERVDSNALSETRYYLYDGGGSVRALADETGAITDRYIYDAFGVLIAHLGTSDNAYLYRGEQWDADLGLYYLRARFMNPDSGRFWNQDTYEGSNTDPASLHKYLYAHADPVNGIDPSGHFTLSQTMSTLGVLGKLYSLAVMSVKVVQVAVDGLVLRNIYQPLMNALRMGVEDPLNILKPLERLLFEKHLIKIEEKALIFGMKAILKSAVIIKPIVAASVVGITTLAVDGFQWQHLIPALGTYLQIQDFVSYAHVLRQDLNMLGAEVSAPPSSGPIALVSYAVGTSRIITNTYEELARVRGGRSL
jgi:RHS repeat-associated protein